MGEIQIRPASPADFAAIGQLSVEAYRADGQLASESGYEHVLADVASRAAGGEILVAVDEVAGHDGTPAVLGAVLFVLPGSHFAELCGAGEAEFRMLAVHPAAQGRGAGEALARACLSRAAQAGARAVRISVRDFAEPAQRLYARLGFVRTPNLDWSPIPGVGLLALHHDLSTV